MLGMSGFRWRIKHNVWHHTYTNIAGFDDDVETYGLMRLTPRAPWKPLYKSGLYFPAGVRLDWLRFHHAGLHDGLDRQVDANHVLPKDEVRPTRSRSGGGKLSYFTLMLALPLLVFPWWQVLIGFLIVMLWVGLVMGVIFQLAHINGDAAFPEPVGIRSTSTMSGLCTRSRRRWNFAPHNWLLNFYIGGLNYQIEHHLLPHICHLNYPRLAPIVRATCEEFGISYHCYATWREAFANHWRELRLLGRVLNCRPSKPKEEF